MKLRETSSKIQNFQKPPEPIQDPSGCIQHHFYFFSGSFLYSFQIPSIHNPEKSKQSWVISIWNFFRVNTWRTCDMWHERVIVELSLLKISGPQEFWMQKKYWVRKSLWLKYILNALWILFQIFLMKASLSLSANYHQAHAWSKMFIEQRETLRNDLLWLHHNVVF